MRAKNYKRHSHFLSFTFLGKVKEVHDWEFLVCANPILGRSLPDRIIQSYPSSRDDLGSDLEGASNLSPGHLVSCPAGGGTITDRVVLSQRFKVEGGSPIV